jgi:hypothetical protein
MRWKTSVLRTASVGPWGGREGASAASLVILEPAPASSTQVSRPTTSERAGAPRATRLRASSAETGSRERRGAWRAPGASRAFPRVRRRPRARARRASRERCVPTQGAGTRAGSTRRGSSCVPRSRRGRDHRGGGERRSFCSLSRHAARRHLVTVCKFLRVEEGVQRVAGRGGAAPRPRRGRRT